MARSLQILFAAALFMASVFETNAQGYFPDIEWSRCYGSSENDEAIDIQATLDGGYVVLGSSSSTDGDLINAPFGNKIWVFKIDSYGNIEWQTYLQYIGLPGNIVATTDGGYILGGSVFTKLDANGAIDWQSPVQSKYVLQTYDGGYALQSNVFGVEYGYPKITRLDNMGSVLWANVYAEDPFWNYYFIDAPIIQTTDSLLIMAGGQREKEISESRWHWLQFINTDGSVKQKKSCYAGFHRTFRETHDHRIVGIANNKEIIKADSLLFWHRPAYFSDATDMEVSNDGTMLVCGWEKNPYDSTSNATITKFLANGDSVINIMPGGSRMDRFQKVALTSDTGYIALGISNSIDGDVPFNLGKIDLWVVKFRKDTSVHPLPPPVLSVNEVINMDEVKVYPNPSNGKVFVNLPEGYERAEVRVLNMLGQEVTAAHSRNGRKETVQLNNSPAGIYLLEVKQGTERKTFRVTIDQ